MAIHTNAKHTHVWHEKILLYPEGQKTKVCKNCGAFYTGLNDNNLCGGLQANAAKPKRRPPR
jgi:hypothetical protein